MTDTKNTTPVDDSNPLPHLDQIINQITSNGDFKEMMNSVSEGLQVTPKESEKDQDELNTTQSPNSLYDISCTFLSDAEGNSVADILTQINTNLEKISNSLHIMTSK